MQTMTPEEREALQRLYRAIRHFRSHMGQTVPSQMIQAFLVVALEEGKPLNQYAKLLGTNMSTASRHFQDLADRNRYKEDGHKLIVRTDNPLSDREKLMTLSSQGRMMRQLVTETLCGQPQQPHCYIGETPDPP